MLCLTSPLALLSPPHFFAFRLNAFYRYPTLYETANATEEEEIADRIPPPPFSPPLDGRKRILPTRARMCSVHWGSLRRLMRWKTFVISVFFQLFPQLPGTAMDGQSPSLD